MCVGEKRGGEGGWKGEGGKGEGGRKEVYHTSFLQLFHMLFSITDPVCNYNAFSTSTWSGLPGHTSGLVLASSPESGFVFNM